MRVFLFIPPYSQITKLDVHNNEFVVFEMQVHAHVDNVKRIVKCELVKFIKGIQKNSGTVGVLERYGLALCFLDVFLMVVR